MTETPISAPPTETPIPPAATPIPTDTYLKAAVDWQAAIHHELKALNTKISFFVFLALCAIGLSLLSLLFK